MIRAGWIFVGCLFLGIGFGLLLDQPGPGTLIGMGAGFIVGAIVEAMGRSRKRDGDRPASS